MNEAGSGPEEARRRLIERSLEDEAFRERLLADPRGALEGELSKSLPEGVEVKVVEETPETLYLVLPPKYATSPAEDELSERELDAVAGGLEDSVPPSYTFYCDHQSTRSKKACDPLP